MTLMFCSRLSSLQISMFCFEYYSCNTIIIWFWQGYCQHSRHHFKYTSRYIKVVVFQYLLEHIHLRNFRQTEQHTNFFSSSTNLVTLSAGQLLSCVSLLEALNNWRRFRRQILLNSWAVKNYQIILQFVCWLSLLLRKKSIRNNATRIGCVPNVFCDFIFVQRTFSTFINRQVTIRPLHRVKCHACGLFAWTRISEFDEQQH